MPHDLWLAEFLFSYKLFALNWNLATVKKTSKQTGRKTAYAFLIDFAEHMRK